MADGLQKITQANSEFRFASYSCECLVDVSHQTRNTKKFTFRLYPKSEPIYYAYIAGKGIVSKNRSRATDGRAVLPDLLLIENGDVDKLKGFIERHGFFLPIDKNTDSSIDAEMLFRLIDRIKATVNLMSAIGEPNTDYMKLLSLTLYLLVSPVVSIDLSNYESPFISCPHDLGQVWNKPYSINENLIRDDDVGYNTDEGHWINDSVRIPKTWLSNDSYADAVGYDSLNLSKIKSNATYLFRNAVTVSSECRLGIDFLFHFCKDVCDIVSWDCNGKLEFADHAPSKANFMRKFDEQLQQALIKLAKQTLKTEIEYNLVGIVPSYDTETMTPTWQVEYLLAGLHLSVFYMRPNIELYRTCENPNCGLPFLVKTTSSKRKYCGSSCSNAMSQRNFRLRVKKQQNIN